MTLTETTNAGTDVRTGRVGTGLLLTGGGARAAYQVGVLQAIAELQQRCDTGATKIPFDIIVGTSAGAINATALACHADNFSTGVTRLAQVWEQFHADQVYHASGWRAATSSLRWLAFALLGWLTPSWSALQPRSLLDSQPLGALLRRKLLLQRVPEMLERGYLRALAVTASCYSSGEHVTFYDAVDQIEDWQRVRRRAVRTRIGVEHLMASSAIPLVFPAIQVSATGQTGYYGDGAMRQMTPLAPVIHLGARRILAVGVAKALEPMDDTSCDSPTYPNFSQVANHALAGIFLDSLAADTEHMQRVNHALSLVTPAQRAATHLKPVDLLTITPSARIDQIAARHTHALPRTVRALMVMLGMRGGAASSRSSALASYLLFEAPFARELMQLGHADAYAQKDQICKFFGWPIL